MSEAGTPTPVSEALAVSHEQGSEDAAVEALYKRDHTAEEATTDEPEPADEPADAPVTEADEADPEADPKADDLVEVDIGGQTYEVPAAVQKAVLRQADYSRKMNEVSAVEKGATERMAQAERLVESAASLADVLAEVKQYEANLARYDKVQWQRLRAENPAEYAAVAADMQTDRIGRDEAMRKAQGIEGDISRSKQTALASQREAMLKTLSKDLKGWGEELGTKISRYAYANGYTQDDVGAWTDPRVVVMANKARLYDEFQAAKTTIKAKAQAAPPVVKPGAPRRSDAANDAAARFRKSTSPEDAIALLEARSKRG